MTTNNIDLKAQTMLLIDSAAAFGSNGYAILQDHALPILMSHMTEPNEEIIRDLVKLRDDIQQLADSPYNELDLQKERAEEFLNHVKLREESQQLSDSPHYAYEDIQKACTEGFLSQVQL